MTETNETTPADDLIARVGETVTAGIEPVTERMVALEDKLEAYEAESRRHSLPGSEDAKFDGEKFSFSKVALGALTGDYEKYCPMEFSMSQELRAQGDNEQQFLNQSVNVDSLGGFFVPNQILQDRIIPLLRKSLIHERLGLSTLMDVTGTPVEIPREVTDTTAESVAEHQGTPSTYFETGMLQLTPKTAQAYMIASRKFLTMASIDAEGYMRKLMARSLATKYNEWLLNGTGGAGEPLGILNTSGVSSHDWTAGGAGVAAVPSQAAAYAKLLLMEGQLADDLIMENGSGELKWLCHPSFVRGLRQMHSDNHAAGTALVNENLEVNAKVFSQGKETAIIGHSYVETGFLEKDAASEVVLGDWSRMLFAMWGNMVIEASNVAEDALRRRQTHIVAHTSVDYAVEEPKAFSVGTVDTSAY